MLGEGDRVFRKTQPPISDYKNTIYHRYRALTLRLAQNMNEFNIPTGTYGGGEWAKLSAKERYFTEALSIGEEVMKKLVAAITATPDPVIDGPLQSLTDIQSEENLEIVLCKA